MSPQIEKKKMHWHWSDMTALVWTCPCNTQVTMSSSMESRRLGSLQCFLSQLESVLGMTLDTEWTLTVPQPELPFTLRTMCAVVEARFIDFQTKDGVYNQKTKF